jgi:NADP-dependent 3-hydroxy acid dehydrogenase YdfG
VAVNGGDLAKIEAVVDAIRAAGGQMVGVVADVPEQDWRSTVDGTRTATFLTLKSFLPAMIQRRRGAIVTMASSAARLPGLAAWITGVTLDVAGGYVMT